MKSKRFNIMTQNFNQIIEINGRKIGKGYDPFIVAEMSANHNGSFEVAKNTIKKDQNLLKIYKQINILE